MEAFEPKPTYEEQLAWLDMVQLIYSEDPEMIKAIKENVIAVRNYEKAIEKELQPVQKEIEEAFEDLVAFGETKGIPLPEDYVDFKDIGVFMGSCELNQSIDNIHTDWLKVKTHISDRNLNLQWEHSVINNRIQTLQAELRSELARKKQFRNKQVIDHCHKSINNLKKWKSQSL